MKRFRDFPLRKKLALIIGLSSGTALLIIAVAMVIYETTTYRTRLLKDATALTDLYGLTLAAALNFNDPKAAKENLSTLSTRHDIGLACVYRLDGSVLAQYVRPDFPKPACPIHLLKLKEYYFSKNHLNFFFPVIYSRELIGMLYLRFDLSTLSNRFLDYGIILVVISLTLFMVSILISMGLKKYVSDPVLKLAQSAQLISTRREYGHRAVVWSNDEMGGLTHDFNQMLDTIELSISLNQATLESTADGILVMNQKGEVSSFNKNFIDLWRIPQTVLNGHSHEQLVTFILEQLKYPEDFFKKITELYTHPNIESYDTLEFKDGRIFERNSRPQRIDKKIVGRVWSFRDVTIRKQTEQSLRESESKFRRVYDSNMIGIAFCDLAGIVYEANDYFFQMVGFKPEQLHAGSLKWTDLTPPEYLGADEDAITQLKTRGVITPYEKEFTRQDGKRIAILLGAALLEGSQTDTVAFFLDISVRKLAELERDKSLVQEREARLEAENALRLREDFLSIAAHELRTPLTPLKIQNDALRMMIKRNPNDPQMESFLKFANISDRQINNLIRLVDDLLDFNRIRTGRLTLEIEETDLSELIRHVVEQFNENFMNNNIEVRMHLEPNVIGSWDRLRIEQVVNNLFTNAIKYGAGKPLLIAVSKDKELATLIVQDFGIGIDEKDKERIFKRFERASSVLNFGGFGLGLYIAREIVEIHHGHILVESQKGEGTKFVVELPLHFHDESQ